MSKNRQLTRQELKKRSKVLYHHVYCKQMKALKIKISEKGLKQMEYFSIIGLSSKETLQAGLQAVDASPFKTIFVVDEKSGAVLFALSKNKQYIKVARKKRPKPPSNPPESPVSYCCQICEFQGGTSCQSLSDGSCICFGADRGAGSGSLDAPLETLAL